MKHTQARVGVQHSAAADVGTLLANDHARLGKLFAEIVIAFRAGDREKCTALWNECESGLEAHLSLEEQLILPEFAKVDAEEAAALVREHAAIRAELGELGIGVDLHCTNAEAVERFVRVLEDHAKREESLMYRWARGNLQPGVQATMRAQLRAALRKAASWQL